MPDWKTRLAVEYTDEDGETVSITPIESFSPTFALNAEALHSIEETHIGVIFSPEQLTFQLTVKTIGDVAAKLTKLALEGKRFDVTLQEQEGSDWAFETVVMSDCIITSAAPTNAVIAGAPTAAFNGFSLGASVSPKTGAAAVVPGE